MCRRTSAPQITSFFRILSLLAMFLGIFPLLAQGNIYTYSGRMDAAFTVNDAISITIPPKVQSFTYYYPLPQTYDYKVNSQATSNLGSSFSVPPSTKEVRIDSYGNRYLYLLWNTPAAGAITGKVSYQVATAADWDAFVTTDTFPVKGVMSDEVKTFLARTDQAQSDDSRLLTLAQTLTSGLTRQHQAVEALVGWVMENVTYPTKEEWNSLKGIDALTTYSSTPRLGVCTNFSHLAIALLRAAGIPARYVSGVALSHNYTLAHPSGTFDIDWYGGAHAWIEVYYPSLGWISYDALRDFHHVDTHRIHMSVSLDDATRPAGKWSWGSFEVLATDPTITSTLDMSTDAAVSWPKEEYIKLTFVSESSRIPKRRAFSTKVTFNTKPVADAGEDLTGVAGKAVTLAGSVIDSDPDDAWSYSWTLLQKPEQANASFQNAANLTPSFTADTAGEYVLSLTITDKLGSESDADTVRITLTAPPPSHYALSGAVLSRTGGAPSAGILILAREIDGGDIKQAFSDVSGVFSLKLPAGTEWQLTIFDPKDNFLGGGWVAAPVAREDGILPGSVEPGGVAGSVLAITGNRSLQLFLATASHITGRVTDASGGPVMAAEIEAVSLAAGAYRAVTDQNGFYRLTVKPAADYRVHVSDTDRFMPVFYDHATSWDKAALIDVTSRERSGVDFVLPPGEEISGTVTGLPAGTPCLVEAWSETVAAWGGTYLTSTGDAVSYTITGLAPAKDYRISFHAREAGSGYLQKGGEGGAWETAALIGAGSRNADIVLSPVFSLSGVVTGLASGTKAELVAASESRGTWGSARVTAGDAAPYSITGLSPADDYRVMARAEGYVSGYWSGSPGVAVAPVPYHRATAVPISGAAVSGVDFTMTPGAMVCGSISGLTLGQKAIIEAMNETHGSLVTIVTGTGGGSDPYTLTGMAAEALYRLQVRSDGHVGGFYRAAGLTDALHAEPVKATGTVSGISFALARGHVISGLIAGLAAEERAHISAWSETGGFWGAATVIAPKRGGGQVPYTITGLGAATDFKVRIEPADHAVQERSGIASTANPADIHFSLRAGVSVSGKVRGTAPFRPVTIMIANPLGLGRTISVTTTAEKEAPYTLTGLQAGAGYTASAASGGIVQYFDKTARPFEATNIDLSGETTPNIDFDFGILAAASRPISGTVRGVGFDTVVTITGWAATTGVWGSTTRVGEGDFRLDLPADTFYKVGFFAPGYSDGYYSGPSALALAPKGATTVDLARSEGVLGTLTFTQGHTLSGLVYADLNGDGQQGGNEAAIPRATVEILGSTTEVPRSTLTGVDGRFSFTGLPNDSYSVFCRWGEGVATGTVKIADTKEIRFFGVK